MLARRCAWAGAQHGQMLKKWRQHSRRTRPGRKQAHAAHGSRDGWKAGVSQVNREARKEPAGPEARLCALCTARKQEDAPSGYTARPSASTAGSGDASWRGRRGIVPRKAFRGSFKAGVEAARRSIYEHRVHLSRAATQAHSS